MPRVAHFEIHADDPERAVTFYSELFGWTFTRRPGPLEYWRIDTGDGSAEPGIDGGLMKRRGDLAGDGVGAYVCTIAVSNLKDTLLRIQELGGKVVVPTMPVPQLGWMAYARDPEGNQFGVLMPDAEAGAVPGQD
ncbi:MAG: VOC family protein [Planctomyces sp.]|nr:VOC family protein [Planctomyces sp.]